MNIAPDQEEKTIIVTQAAAAEVRRQAERRGAGEPIIRLGVRGGGCTGFSYLLEWEDGRPRETDLVFRQHGIAVYVDPRSFKLLQGMELDFSGSLMGHGFQFNNPNAKGTCGCGESVQF